MRYSTENYQRPRTLEEQGRVRIGMIMCGAERFLDPEPTAEELAFAASLPPWEPRVQPVDERLQRELEHDAELAERSWKEIGRMFRQNFPNYPWDE